MKEIEDIIEYLKTFDSYSDTGAFDEEIKGLMVGSKQLLETVESLKCCGNCGNDFQNNKPKSLCLTCIRSGYEYSPHMTDNWQKVGE